MGRCRGSMAIAVLAVAELSGAATADDGSKWAAVEILEGGSSHTCRDVQTREFELELRGNVLNHWTAGSAPFVYKLSQPLKPDGSGKVTAMSERNRPVTLEFDPGTGPRRVRFWPPYSPCVYSWLPAKR